MFAAASLPALAAAAAVATWWLGQIALAQDDTAAAALSTSALQAIVTLQSLLLVTFGPWLGATVGSRAARPALLCALALSWPFIALVWSATPLPGWSLIEVEAVLAVLALLLSWIGAALRSWARSPAAVPLIPLASVIAVCALWSMRGAWLGWLS